MTMIISEKGVLYTDSMTIDTSTGDHIVGYQDDAKVVRMDGYAYLGLTGCLPSQFGIGEFYKEAFYLWLGSGKPECVDVKSNIDFDQVEQDPHGIMLTKKQTYVVTFERIGVDIKKGKKTFTIRIGVNPVPDKHIVYVGCANTMASLLHRMGKTAKEIITIACKTDWFTGGNIHVYNRRYLKALPKLKR